MRQTEKLVADGLADIPDPKPTAIFEFERLLADKTESNPSFAEKARARWQQQVSDRPDLESSQ